MLLRATRNLTPAIFLYLETKLEFQVGISTSPHRSMCFVTDDIGEQSHGQQQGPGKSALHAVTRHEIFIPFL